MNILESLFQSFQKTALTEREKGTYFEEFIQAYLQLEPSYKDLYSKVWTYADWAQQQGIDARDTGIDLVAQTRGTNEIHAIQCKFYAAEHRLQKSDIDSFFTASGKKPFSHRLIVSTTYNWSEHAEDALRDQQPPCSKIDLHDLENSQIDWTTLQSNKAPALKPKKQLREHQKTAVDSVIQGLKDADRGKLIMACGTGKTFTSLKIAEQRAGKGKRVLFLVPSLNLLSQTLTEWTQESDIPLHSFAVCSDSDVGKKRKKNAGDEDIVQTFTHELRFPATTNPHSLANAMQKRHDDQHISVVFSTYHSIDVISQAQKEHGLPDFDLVICDEAHRTTGATFGDDDESAFVRIHKNEHIRATKRLYMTATPRVYSDVAEAQAEKDQINLYGMNRAEYFGKELFVLTFSEAVRRELLCDYKVIVLAVDELHVSRRLQTLLSDENNQLKVDDAAKIIGCWKALSKQGLEGELVGDAHAMRRAVAFCQVIEKNASTKAHKVSSKQIKAMFQTVVEAYQKYEAQDTYLRCIADHVDGSMNASQKEAKLQWLKEAHETEECRILSNVRCLSEGVDVPALDAVLFLTPRNSQVDVVQSVGRVMRRAEGKKRGYVILPVVIPAGVEPHEALNDNKTYAVVWQVLQALRSHDDRFDAMVNKLDLIGKDTSKMEIIAVTDNIKQPSKAASVGKRNNTAGRNSFGIGSQEKPPPENDQNTQGKLEFEIGTIERAIYAKLVQKCGNRHHWEDWANDIAKIAQTHIARITTILENPALLAEREVFNSFAEELRRDLNDSISHAEIIEMLVQHLITKPVFDALFSDYAFAKNNPISKNLQFILEVLQSHHLEKETDTLQSFYASVKMRAEGIDKAEGKQKIILELYDKFFRNAFPKMTERLGIVYTPVEVVDFIIHSVNDILKAEFNQTLGSENVHIIDPFTGTGTFITRLLQSGLISTEQLPHKYKYEIHANELVLLAYYIASINIETVYHSLIGGEYQPFEGICLTDTFQMSEKEDLISDLLEDNSKRRKRQKKLDIRVILGNPPYSAGQTSANDNNQNVVYPHLDERIRTTYADKSTATNKNALYDSYIRAIRWASDRVKDCGVIGFVTNAGWLDSNSADGLRKCLADEFSSLYVFHLRGNARTAGELRRKEKDNVFGMGSRAPIAISLLVKNPKSTTRGQIHFHDIGDYLSREEKLEKISTFQSIAGITESDAWKTLTPDAHGDWLNQRDDSFGEFVVLGNKDSKQEMTLFENYSNGVKTQRDSWCYNASKNGLSNSVEKTIDFYNSELERFNEAHLGKDRKTRDIAVDDFINADPKQISWTRALKQDLAKDKSLQFEITGLIASLYRPFTKQWMYFNRRLNEMVYQMPRIFPHAAAGNRVISITGRGATKDFTALITDTLPDLEMVSKGQCFPEYVYENEADVELVTAQHSTAQHNHTKSVGGTGAELGYLPLSQHDQRLHGADEQHTARLASDRGFAMLPNVLVRNNGGWQSMSDLFGIETPVKTNTGMTRREAITDAGLKHFQEFYPQENITKKDIFYYVYGLLHSPDYREKYADNLAKELPRIPRVKTAADFWAFTQAGRELAALHINYEQVEKYPVQIESTATEDSHYRVEKMKYGKIGKDKDLSTVIYNARITIKGIPKEAYEYIVNGKSALDWVMERQCVKTDKDSGIVNDANNWAIETMNNPKYPLELFQRVITVSLETMRIVKNLPSLEI